MLKTTKIIFPNKPHLDPIAAYWVLLNYGQEKFPGVKEASLAVWKAAKTPEPETLKDWEAQGVISFDIEGGTYDHHGTEKCTTVLLADQLGVKDNPELQALLRYVQEDDMAGLHNGFGELAGILKAMYKRGDTTENVVKFTLNVIDALQAREKGWFVSAKEEFETKAQVFKIKRGQNKIKLAVIKSNNLDVANYAKQEKGVAITVQQHATGHIFIFTNAFYRLNIKNIVGAIRLKEAELTNKPIKNLQTLKNPGKIIEVQNWFYHDTLNAMMNGSAALAETPATKISLEDVVGLVVFGLSTDQGDPSSSAYQTYQALFSRVPR